MPDDGSGLAGDSGLVPLLLKLGGGGLGGGTNLLWTAGSNSPTKTGLGGKNSPPSKWSTGFSSGSIICKVVYSPFDVKHIPAPPTMPHFW